MPHIVVLYENKKWDMGLIAALERAGCTCTLWPLFDINMPLTKPPLPRHSIVLNRFSPSFSTRSNGNTLGSVRSLVRFLESHGHRVINGSQAVELEVSKVAQIIACRQVGLQCPYTEMVVGGLAPAALERWKRRAGDAGASRQPVVVKPNCGGSGNNVRVFPAVEALEEACKRGELNEISVDGITLIQQMVEAPFIYRLEFAGHAFLYAVKIRTQGGSFNRCRVNNSWKRKNMTTKLNPPPPAPSRPSLRSCWTSRKTRANGC